VLIDCHRNADLSLSVDVPELQVHHFRDVFFYPKTDIFPHVQWGLYDRLGRILPAAALGYGWVNLQQGQDWVLKRVSHDPFAREIECAVYGGMVGLHYGHTLLEFLPRLWYLRRLHGPSVKILVHCGLGLTRAWETPWFRDLMALIGIVREDLISPLERVMVRNLLVPDAAFQINAYCSRIFADFTHWIGDRAGLPEDESDAPYFLTKMMLRKGVVNFVNEDEVCSRLEQAGFRVVATEELALREQIGLFRSRAGTCGILGSNIHTNVFSRSSYGVALNIGPDVSDSFHLLDETTGADFRYVTSWSIHEVERQERFLRSFRFEDPVGIADAMVAAFDAMKTRRAGLDVARVERESGGRFVSVRGGAEKRVYVNGITSALTSAVEGSMDKELCQPLVGMVTADGREARLYSLAPEIRYVRVDERASHRPWIVCDITEAEVDGQVVRGLRHRDTGRWLTIIPEKNNHDANFSAGQMFGWEIVDLEALPAGLEEVAARRWDALQALCGV